MVVKEGAEIQTPNRVERMLLQGWLIPRRLRRQFGNISTHEKKNPFRVTRPGPGAFHRICLSAGAPRRFEWIDDGGNRARHRYQPAELAAISEFHVRGTGSALSGRSLLASSCRLAHPGWTDDIHSVAEEVS